MTTVELLRQVEKALVSDARLNDWCREKFGRAPSVYLGINEERPPAEEEYPVLAVIGIDQVRGDSKAHIEWLIELGVGVLNEEILVQGNERIQTGFLQAEELRELTENALFRARIAGLETTGDASAVSYYPLFVSYTTVSVKVLKSTRRGLP